MYGSEGMCMREAIRIISPSADVGPLKHPLCFPFAEGHVKPQRKIDARDLFDEMPIRDGVTGIASHTWAVKSANTTGGLQSKDVKNNEGNVTVAHSTHMFDSVNSVADIGTESNWKCIESELFNWFQFDKKGIEISHLNNPFDYRNNAHRNLNGLLLGSVIEQHYLHVNHYIAASGYVVDFNHLYDMHTGTENQFYYGKTDAAPLWANRPKRETGLEPLATDEVTLKLYEVMPKRNAISRDYSTVSNHVEFRETCTCNTLFTKSNEGYKYLNGLSNKDATMIKISTGTFWLWFVHMTLEIIKTTGVTLVNPFDHLMSKAIYLGAPVCRNSKSEIHIWKHLFKDKNYHDPFIEPSKAEDMKVSNIPYVSDETPSAELKHNKTEPKINVERVRPMSSRVVFHRSKELLLNYRGYTITEALSDADLGLTQGEPEACKLHTKWASGNLHIQTGWQFFKIGWKMTFNVPQLDKSKVVSAKNYMTLIQDQ